MLIAGCGDGGAAVEPTDREPVEGIWISPEEIASLPTSGPAWDRLVEYAQEDWGVPDIGDQNSNHDVHTLAGALYAVRLDDAAMRSRVEDALAEISQVSSTEILAVSRNTLSYVVAADLVDYRPDSFVDWLDELLNGDGDSRAGIETMHESAMRDPSNHGAHARASAVAIGRFTGDDELVGQVAARFRDWLGRSSDGFEWRELDWQADPDHPVGVNPRGAEIEGSNVDGVLPEDQRRSGPFRSPAPQEPYEWEAMQGTVTTAELLYRAGYDTWEWGDVALERALTWLYDVNEYPAEGDDRWIPWIANARTTLDLPVETPTRPGKSIGFADWTHAG